MQYSPSQASVSPHLLAPPPEVLGHELGSDGTGVGEHDSLSPGGHNSPSVRSVEDRNSPPPQPIRSSSPPVPALMRKLTGWFYVLLYVSLY